MDRSIATANLKSSVSYYGECFNLVTFGKLYLHLAAETEHKGKSVYMSRMEMPEGVKIGVTLLNMCYDGILFTFMGKITVSYHFPATKPLLRVIFLSSATHILIADIFLNLDVRWSICHGEKRTNIPITCYLKEHHLLL